MTSIIEWCEPPGPSRCWKDISLELSTRRDEWALILERQNQADAYNAIRSLRRYGCVCKVRKSTTGEGWRVWSMMPREELA